MMSIGEIIYQHRKKAALSQEELGDLLGVTRQTISLWETDQTLPSTANLVRLTEIFHISMDELCGNGLDNASPIEKEQNSTDKPERIAETSTEFTKRLLWDMQVAVFGNIFTVCSVIAVFAALCLIMMLFDRTRAPVAVSAVLLAASLGYIIIILALITRNVRKNLKSQPNHKNVVKFFFDRFEVESVSNTSNLKLTKSYSGIKKVRCTKDYIFIFYDNVVTPLVKANLTENANVICRLLKIDYEEITDKHRNLVKRLLLVTFIASILSIFIAMLICGVCANSSPIPEYHLTMAEYMWVFYLLMPIPAASAILGFVFLTKKYKCKKNIIAGIIMIVLLAIYGSFTPLIAGNVKHDFRFVNEIENSVPISLPDSGYVSYTLTGSNNRIAEAMVKFDYEQVLLENVERDNWATEASQLPTGIIPIYYAETTKTYDYFYLYDYDCNAGTNEISGNHTGHVYIYFAYSKTNNIMQIVCFSI